MSSVHACKFGTHLHGRPPLVGLHTWARPVSDWVSFMSSTICSDLVHRLAAIANPARPPQNHCMSLIPIMRPRLPSADRLAPYLKSIDASRLYSNFGPLAVSLEDRLAEHYGLNQGTVATVANATLGLAIALAVQQPPAGSLCAMPAWTFVAPAHASVIAG